MNKCFSWLILLSTVLILSACSSEDSKLGPEDILDTETDTIYSLGMNRSVFDKAFGHLGIEEETDGDKVKVCYLDCNLTVTFQDYNAVSFFCSADTSRFTFYNFDFSMDISDIEGRYEASGERGNTYYSRYYDEEGNDVALYNAKYHYTVSLDDGLLGDGGYSYISIYLNDSTGDPSDGNPDKEESIELRPGDILDTKTNIVYSLGMKKEVFDEDFGYLGFEEIDSEVPGSTIRYNGGPFYVTYLDGVAVKISCKSYENRFSFYDFDFKTDISKFKKYYNSSSGLVIYDLYYNENGEPCSRGDSHFVSSVDILTNDSPNTSNWEYASYITAYSDYLLAERIPAS